MHPVDSVKVTLRNGWKTLASKTERKIKENTVTMGQFQAKFILLFIRSVDGGGEPKYGSHKEHETKEHNK